MLAASTVSTILIELGAVLLVLAVCGRLAARIGLPSIPLYLLAGLLLGEGSPIALQASSEFIRIGADLGVVLLLLLLGLEYTPEELAHGMRTNWLAGIVDLVASFTPGLLAGLLLGWDPVACVLLGGITYITSSGIVAKLLSDLNRLGNRETSTVLSMLVMEDIVMAVFLPIAAVLIVPIQQAHYLMGLDPLLMSFIVVIIGGLGSIRGSVIAALLIGLADGIISMFFTPTLASIIATLAVALVLVLRPQGLFGTAAR